MQRLIKVDGKVRTDATYPAGFMDVISIEKTGENFRLVYDTKGRFTVHRISTEEAEYKLAKVKRVQLGRGGIPCTIRLSPKYILTKLRTFLSNGDMLTSDLP